MIDASYLCRSYLSYANIHAIGGHEGDEEGQYSDVPDNY
jgi:hypothetical protein